MTKPNLLNNLPPHISNSHKNTSCVLPAPLQKAINLKLFLEFVAYDRKMPKFFLFQKHLNKSTWKINSYFSIITQILNASKAELAIYCNKSKCIQIQVDFHFSLILNTIALRWPTRSSLATFGPLPSFMWLLRSCITEVPLNNMHTNKCLVKFFDCHIGGVWYLQ